MANPEVGGFVPQDIGRLTEKEAEPGNTLGETKQTTVLPEGTNTQVTLELIKNNYGYVVRSRF